MHLGLIFVIIAGTVVGLLLRSLFLRSRPGGSVTHDWIDESEPNDALEDPPK